MADCQRPGDHALFAGNKLVGLAEAKRRNKNVMEVLPKRNATLAGLR